MDELKDFIETFQFESSFENDKFQKDGVFGYMSYDSVKYFETLNLTNISHGDDIPEMIYCVYEHIIVVNVFNNTTTIISYSENKNSIIEIDLENQTIASSDGEVFSFEVDPFKKHCLLNGLDDIGLTMEKEDQITAYESKAAQIFPWA